MANFQKDFDGDNRCIPREEAPGRCKTDFIVDYELKFNILQSRPLTTGKGIRNPVQLTPQHVSLTNMRVGIFKINHIFIVCSLIVTFCVTGQVHNITLQFRPAEDYPVDLYFLMDLSNSMNDDKDSLEKLSGRLAQTLSDITIYYSLGFGSFVDKNVLPFVDRFACFSNRTFMCNL